jgi:uncharacterized protein (DUF58 family)
VKAAASSGVSRLAPERITARASRAGRLGAAFGSRFFVALLAGLVWTGPAWQDHRFLYAMPVWDLIILLVCFLDFERLPKPGTLEVTREWQRPLSLGETSAVTLRVRGSTARALWMRLEDDQPPDLNASGPDHEIQLAAAVPANAGGAADAKTAAAFSYSICPGARGDYETGGVYLRYQGPLRFAEARAFVNLTQRVRVYPSLRESEQSTLYLIRSRQIELEKRLKRKTGVGREFESLRDYRSGDEPRDICWSATARRGKPITRTYQVERSQTVFIVLDAGRLLLAKIGPGRAADSGVTLNKLDHAINAALGLARVALYSGDAVGLTAYARSIQARLPAGRGTPHLRALVESLAQVRGELVEADHGRAAAYLLATQRRRCLVVWLTELAETAATPEVIESAARLLPRHLVLFVAIAQPELRRLAEQRPASVREAYRYVAAQEMLQRREALLGRLRGQGALALELEPERLASGVVNQYLEVKERSLL